MANDVTTSFKWKSDDGLKQIAKDLDAAEDKGKAAAAALSAFADELAADMARGEAAASALGQALGPELVAKLDQSGAGVQGLIAHFQRLGLTFEDIEANAEELAATTRKFDDLGQSIGGTAKQTDDLSHSARGANSALANMVGNTTQDLGELGGVVGSLGVGLGQMGEYAADAALGGEKLTSALGSMLKVAGPIAGIALGVAAIKDVMGDAAKVTAEVQASQERWTKAIEDGGSVTEAFAAQLAETREVTVRLNAELQATLDEAIKKDGWGKFFKVWESGRADMVDVTDILAKAGTNVQDLSRAVVGGAESQQRFRSAVAATNLSGDEQKLLLALLEQQVNDYTKALENAERFKAVFDPITESAQRNYTSLIAQGEAFQESQRRMEAHDNALKNSGHLASDYERALTSMGEAFQEAAGEATNFGIALDDALGAGDKEGSSFENTVRDAIDLQEQLDGIAAQFDEVNEAAEAMAEDGAAGARRYRGAVRDLRIQLLDVIDDLDHLSAKDRIRLIAEVDTGSVDDLLRVLGELSRGFMIPVTVAKPTFQDAFSQLTATVGAGASGAITPVQSSIPSTNVSNATVINNYPIGYTTTNNYQDRQIDTRRNGAR